MRYSPRIVAAATGQMPQKSPVGWAGLQQQNDSLTWGQSAVLSSPQLDIGGEGSFTFANQQVMSVLFERPTSWTLMIIVDLTRPPAEPSTVIVPYFIYLGVGQARGTIIRSHTFASPAPAAGIPEQFVDTLTVPAQAIQLDATASFGGGGILTGAHSVRLTGIVAPVFT
jgi:hypothetical protein